MKQSSPWMPIGIHELITVEQIKKSSKKKIMCHIHPYKLLKNHSKLSVGFISIIYSMCVVK